MCYPPMDELSKEAWMAWMSTGCNVFYKFLHDKSDRWIQTGRPPWNNKSYVFRLHLTRTHVFNYLYYSSMKLYGLTNREAVIYAVEETETEWRNSQLCQSVPKRTPHSTKLRN